MGLFWYDFIREFELDDKVGWVFGNDKITLLDDISLKR